MNSQLMVGLLSSSVLSQGAVKYEIRLRDQLVGPNHAIRLIGGQFLVSHALGSGRGQSPVHRVCLVEKGDEEDPGSGGAAATTATDHPPAAGSQKKKRLPVLRRESKKPPPAPAAAAPAGADAAAGSSAAGVPTYEAHVTLTYGDAPGSGDGQLSGPRGLAVDGRGRIFVADRENNRVVVVDHALGAGRQLEFEVVDQQPAIEEPTLHSPRCVFVDKARGRLYVGEEVDGGRVVAIEHVDSFADDL